MKFFFDQCISPRLAQAMQALVASEHLVVHLRDRYSGAESKTVTDVQWITDLGTEGAWIILSGDIRIRSRPAERDALRAAKLTAFFLADGYPKLDKWEQIRWLIDKWPEIEDLARRVGAGSMFRVPKRGKIETF